LENLAHEVGVELVASKSNQYLASSGLNLISSSFHKVILFIFNTIEAIFSFTSISTLEEKGKTSTYQAAFL
jgi:hypothetical protein